MAAGVGQIIEASDYNTIRTKIANVMGVGGVGNGVTADFGYGQQLNSAAVNPLDAVLEKRKITKAQWDDLRWDIINASIHQLDTIPDLTIVATTSPIKYGASHPNYQYNTTANTITSDKYKIATTQSITTIPAAAVTRSASWANTVSCQVVLTFATSEQARYFWNSGGILRFNSSRSGGSSLDQNTAWTRLLTAVGNQDFNNRTVTPTGVGVYTLTNAFQTYYENSASSPYSNNKYRLQAKTDVANNTTGTGRIFTFNIQWVDGYVDSGPEIPPGDTVDGTLTLNITEIRAAGTLLPAGSGNFAITPPIYSVSSISGS
jgi:hypothetical protein